MDTGNTIEVTRLSSADKATLARYIRDENLKHVNSHVSTVSVKESFYTKYGKRILDIVISAFALIATLPINCILAVVTFLDVGSPILFKQQRIGKGERRFTIYKFRNMTNATDKNGQLLPPNERVTRWGRFVRRTSLDELLNFVSVFRGEMSLVGPRPLLDIYLERFNKRDRQRYAVKPGLECPSYRPTHGAPSWEEKLDNDIWYIQNCSLKTDIILLLRIIRVAFDREATAVRSAAGVGGFLGYNRDGSVISTKCVPERFCDMLCKEKNYKTIEDGFLKNG